MHNQTYLTLLCLVLSTALFSQTTQFTGTVDDNWFEPANWTEGVPETDDIALIGGGTTVSVNSALIVDFSIQNFGTLIVNAEINNNGSILNDGTMDFLPAASFDNNSSFQNNSTVAFHTTAVFRNNPGASFLNSGNFTLETLLENLGDITNNGTLNAPAGTLQTAGTFNNNQVLTTQSLTILSGSTFNNNFGSELNVVDTGMGILVQGLLNNFGTLTNEGALVVETTLVNVGLITSLGDIDIETGAQLTNDGGGTLDNQGTLTNQGTIVNGATLRNSGFLNNFGQIAHNNTWENLVAGTIVLRPGSLVTLNPGSVIENAGSFDNRGDIASAGNIQNKAGGEFLNSGEILNNSGSVLQNEGDFTNTEDIDVSDVFLNNGTFINGDDINIESGGVFTNAGTFRNESGADVRVRQDFFNEAGGLFINDGRLSVFVRASIDGNLINDNEIVNEGDITIQTDGILTNNDLLEQNGGNILNEGILDNAGNLESDECSTIHNASKLENGGSLTLKAILFQRGTITGNLVDVDGGYIHTAPDSNAPALCKNGSFGADINGDVKVYASELIAFANFDSCANIVYLANGEGRPAFSCSDIGSVLDVDVVLRTRLNDSLTCVAEVTPEDVLEPQFTTFCPEDIVLTTTEEQLFVTWDPPVAVDNCTETIMASNFEPGDLFSSGNTSVLYTATDTYGNVNNCGFNVVINGLTTCTEHVSPSDQATDVDFNSVTLAWEAAPNAIIYDVYLGTDNPPTEIVSPGVPATSVMLMNLDGNTVYYWYVVPRNLNGDATGCESGITSFTTALPCDPVTDAGTIGDNQVLCDANIPGTIGNVTAASGGSGTLEYVWERSTVNPFTGSADWQLITGATDAAYTPGTLAETTWYRRGARREGCDDYLFTFPVEIQLLDSVIPQVELEQPSCGLTEGSISIINLPVGWYSQLNSGATLTDQTFYDGLTPGVFTVTIGLNGCEASTSAEIETFYAPPVAKCKSITRQLSGNSVTVKPIDFDDDSEFTCGPLTYTINGGDCLTFYCSSTGTQAIDFQVMDAFGQSDLCQTTIIIKDTEAPQIDCKDIVVPLDGSGQVNISPEDVFETGSDNCGSVQLKSVEPATFNCTDIGVQEVLLTATDNSGLFANCTAKVTVLDTDTPQVTCKNITVELDANGSASISREEVFGGGADNCGNVNPLAVFPSVFSCTEIGVQEVTLIVDDGSGMITTCISQVTVLDVTPPEIFCKDARVEVNGDCLAGIIQEDVFDSGQDQCGGFTLESVTPAVFDCSVAGIQTVELVARDESGNEAVCEAKVEVVINEDMPYAYLLLAKEEVHLHGNTVFGNIGVWKDDKEAKIHDETTVNGNLRAPKIDLGGNSLLNGNYKKAQAPKPGPFKSYSQMVAGTNDDDGDDDDDNGFEDIKIPDNYQGIFLLEGKRFGKIEVGENSKTKFTAEGEILVEEIKLKDADAGRNTGLLFTGNTDLILHKKLELGKRSLLNWDGAACVKIYVEDDNVVIKERSKIQASIDVRYGDLKIDKSKAEEPTELVGQFVAKKIDADDYVEWYWQVCSTGGIPAPAPLVVLEDELELVANAVVGGVDLDWVTNTEYKNQRFMIERSFNGVDFEPILEVSSTGEGKDYELYRGKDGQPNTGVNYYRVHAEFEDGNTIMSEVRRIFCPFSGRDMEVFPNPADTYISFWWEDFAGWPARVWIYNAQGVAVIHRIYDALPGEAVRFEVDQLPEGMYYITVNVDGYRERTKKFMVGH